MMPHVLVTGSNGFLGSAVVNQLLNANILVRTTGIEATPLRAKVDYIPADITRLEQIKPLLKGISTVMHIAGLAHIFSPDDNRVEKFRQINEIGTANMASAASEAGVKHFILISSVSVYGSYTQGVYDEKNPCNPVGAYALSKHNAELRAIEIAQKSGMALTVLRLATLYGEGDPGNICRLIQTLYKGYFLWIGDGRNRKSLLYKRDAARACLAVVERPSSGVNIFNVSAPPCTMREVVDGITEALGNHLFPLHVPASLALILSKHLSRIPNRRMGELHQTVKKWLAEAAYDAHRFEEVYSFQTQTSLKSGLKLEADWYRQKNGYLFR